MARRHGDFEMFAPEVGAAERAGFAKTKDERGINLALLNCDERLIPAHRLKIDRQCWASSAEHGEVGGETEVRNRVTHTDRKKLGAALFDGTRPIL